jgi:hypothetical protein
LISVEPSTTATTVSAGTLTLQQGSSETPIVLTHAVAPLMPAAQPGKVENRVSTTQRISGAPSISQDRINKTAQTQKVSIPEEATGETTGLIDWGGSAAANPVASNAALSQTQWVRSFVTNLAQKDDSPNSAISVALPDSAEVIPDRRNNNGASEN